MGFVCLLLCLFIIWFSFWNAYELKAYFWLCTPESLLAMLGIEFRLVVCTVNSLHTVLSLQPQYLCTFKIADT